MQIINTRNGLSKSIDLSKYSRKEIAEIYKFYSDLKNYKVEANINYSLT